MENHKLLRLPAVMGVVGLRRSAIYARCADGRMPPPCHLGRGAVWPADEIEDWISRVREHGEPPVGTYALRSKASPGGGMSVRSSQRFTRHQPCPICAGFDDARREGAMSLGSWNLVLLAFPGPFAQFFPKCRQVDVREGAGLKTGLKDDRAVRIGPVVMYAEDWPRLRRDLRVANLSDVKYPPPAVPGSKCRESNVCGKQTT